MSVSPILSSDASSRSLHAGEEGMLTLASLFAVTAFLLLISLLANTGMVTARKLETQNAADAAAYSAGVEMARGMNSITAINHLIGELTAIVILIHSLGGDELDQGKQLSTSSPGDDTDLTLAYQAASNSVYLPPDGGGISPFGEAYDVAKQDSFKVGGALFKSYMRLKQVLAWAYWAHAIGNATIAAGEALVDTGIGAIVGGPMVIDGVAICIGCLAFEAKVYQEWQTLYGLELADENFLNPIIKQQLLQNAVIPLMYKYEEMIVALYSSPIPLPGLLNNPANTAATGVGPANHADCSLYPLSPQLPVQKEPLQLSDPNKSQLMRATTPWVQWWRQSWMQFGRNALVLSRFACWIEDETNDYTPKIVQRLRDQGTQLYILKDLKLNSSDKTHELWMNNNAEAEKLFTLMGFAHRSAPPLFSNGIFHQENPNGFVCYAQAMFYNANPQDPNSTGDSDWQPVAGWDTLNWQNRVPEYRSVHSGDGCGDPPNVPLPQIQLNWQCKLIPTTRLTEATLYGFQQGPIGTVLGHTLPDQVFTLPRTH